MKNILVSDYDETFYKSEDDIKKNIAALNKYRNADNIFVIATGRGYEYFKSQIKNHPFLYDFLILNHGATILNNNNEIIYSSTIDTTIVDDLINDLKVNESKTHFFCNGLKNYKEKTKNIAKINIVYNSIEETIGINKKICREYSDYISSYINRSYSLEIVSKGISKKSAVKYILDNYNLLKSNIYVIGDGYSDIEMIKEFHGFAIKDAINDVKDIAVKEYNSVRDLVEDILNK